MNVEQEIGNLKILVVDDDDILRETVVALLSLQGHHILTANTAEEANFFGMSTLMLYYWMSTYQR